jgi:hypothetical protein
MGGDAGSAAGGAGDRFGPGGRIGGTGATRQGAVRDAFSGGLEGGGRFGRTDGEVSRFGLGVLRGSRGRKKQEPEVKQRYGSSAHISRAPTKSPYEYSLLGSPEVANTAARTLLS